MGDIRSKGTLQNCAEKMVKQALAHGSSFADIETTLNVLADMQKRTCVAQALGAEFVSRMTKPLAAGRRVLEEAEAVAVGAVTCGCAAGV